MSIVYPSEAAPELVVPLVNGEEWNLVESQPEHFTIVVFYRGHHCPICKTYLKEIEESYDQAKKEGMEVIAISMDTIEKACSTIAEVASSAASSEEKKDDASTSLKLPVAYGLTEEQARNWGLYISSKRPFTNEPEVFSEPGLFVIRPDNSVYMVQVQSTPLTRPDFQQLLGGLQYVIANNYPARGDLTKK